MLKRIAVVGSVVAVAGLGLGGAATAWSGAPAAQAAAPAAVASAAVPGALGAAAPAATTTAPTPSKHTSKHTGKHKKRASLAKRLSQTSHATWVTKHGKTGTFITHDAVRGAVSAVAAGSVTIKATDGTSETFVVNGSTKVRAGGTTGTLGQVKVGDRVAVVGTGSTPMTATRVVDRGAPGTKHAGKAKSTTTTTPTS